MRFCVIRTGKKSWASAERNIKYRVWSGQQTGCDIFATQTGDNAINKYWDQRVNVRTDTGCARKS